MMKVWKAILFLWWEVSGMNKLLSAGFYKMCRSKIFRICLLFSAGYPLFQMTLRLIERTFYYPVSEPVDTFTILDLMFLGIVLAAFVSLYLGREYSDGVIRNKLIIGHSRMSIYLANLLTVTLGAFLMHGIFFLAMFLLGRLYGLPMELGFGELAPAALLGFLFIIAYASIFTMVSMLTASGSVGPVVALIIAFFLMIMGISIYSALSDMYAEIPPELLADPGFNPLASRPKWQQVIFPLLYNALPSSQAMQLMDYVAYAGAAKAGHLSTVVIEPTTFPLLAGTSALYDLLIAALTTAIGILLFRRKDLN